MLYDGRGGGQEVGREGGHERRRGDTVEERYMEGLVEWWRLYRGKEKERKTGENG